MFNVTLKKLRIKHNLTQAQLGEMCNISAKSISKYETGRSEPELSFLYQLVKIFNVDFNELLDFNNFSNIKKEEKNININVSKTEVEFLKLFRSLEPKEIEALLVLLKSKNKKLDNIVYMVSEK